MPTREDDRPPRRVRTDEPFHEAVPATVVGIADELEPVRANVVGDSRDTLPKRLALLGVGLLVLAVAALGYRQADQVLDQSDRNYEALLDQRGQIAVVTEALRDDLALNRDLLLIIRAQQEVLEREGLVEPGQVLFPTDETVESLEAEIAEQEANLDRLEDDVAESDDPAPRESPRTGPSGPESAPAPPGGSQGPGVANQAPTAQQEPAPPPPVLDVPLLDLPPTIDGPTGPLTGPGGLVG